LILFFLDEKGNIGDNSKYSWNVGVFSSTELLYTSKPSMYNRSMNSSHQNALWTV